MTRAISIRQPWVQASAEGLKLVENRGAGFQRSYLGPLYLHAGSAWSKRGETDPRILASPVVPDPKALTRSAVLAVSELVNVHPATPGCCSIGGSCHPWGELEYQAADGTLEGQVLHLVLEDVLKLLQPVPWRAGRLGLWVPPPELVAAVEHEVDVTTWR